jgi:D-tyrosyl-tRNA(Tyr) deacylase
VRALIQRVASARVEVEGRPVGAIGRGLLVLVGMHRDDTPADGEWLARKVLALRVFEDEQGKMARSVGDVGGEILVVSQFTLHGELNKGTRPDFGAAMPTEAAAKFYADWVALLRRNCALRVEEGRFGAMMQVHLVNDGPVTLMVDSR